MARADVVIVGCGIGGATLALAAGRRGRRVAVLDPSPLPRHDPYPEILWGDSLGAFDRLGVGDEIRRAAAVPLRGVRVRDPRGARVLEVGPAALRDERVRAWSTDPTATRRILLRAALETGVVEHHGGVTATRLLREGVRVTGVEGAGPDGDARFHAALVVGADGHASLVRRACGIALRDRPFPLDFVVAGGPVPKDVPEGFASARVQPAGFRRGLLAVALAPLPDGRAGLVALVHRGAFPDPPGAAFARAARALEPALAAWDRLEEARLLTRRVGHATTYARDGAVLVGDAAHPVSPLGGQGADMAIADALALEATALARAAPGRAPDAAALRAYERERRGANDSGLASSRRGALLLRAARRVPGSGAAALLGMRAVDLLPRALEVWLARRKAHAFERG